MTTEPWLEHAACRGMDADLWFPDHGGNPTHDTANAKAVCHTCPVRAACLDYAQRENIHHGIWGGYTVQERRQLRRQRRLGGAA